MPRHRSLINKSAVKARFAAAGFRTSQRVLDYLEAIVSGAIRTGIRGMVGLARRTVTVEEIHRGKLLGDRTAPSSNSKARNSRRKVNPGLLRR